MGFEESDRVGRVVSGSSLSTTPEEEVLLWTGIDGLSLSSHAEEGDLRPAALEQEAEDRQGRGEGESVDVRSTSTSTATATATGEENQQLQHGDSHNNGKSEAMDDWVCPICLNEVSFVETAIIKDCNHLFCATCILNWVLFKQEAPRQTGFREALSPSSHLSEKCICPTCRNPFDILCTYRHLDGTLSDTLLEENVCLLLRADWFDNNKFANLKSWKGKAESPSSNVNTTSARKLYGADDYEAAAYDNDEHDYEEDYYDDYDMHSYHKGHRSMKASGGGGGGGGGSGYGSSSCSSGASSSSARLVIGNRRWGKEGYVAGSRMYATPSSSSSGSGSGSGSSNSKGKGKAQANMGRRAKRTAKRNAMDRAVV